MIERSHSLKIEERECRAWNTEQKRRFVETVEGRMRDECIAQQLLVRRMTTGVSTDAR